mgnify:CR=1 FL=1
MHQIAGVNNDKLYCFQIMKFLKPYLQIFSLNSLNLANLQSSGKCAMPHARGIEGYDYNETDLLDCIIQIFTRFISV